MPLDRRRRSVFWRRVLIVWIVVFTALTFYAIDKNSEARDALCELRLTRERSLVRTEKYLAEHPNGVAGFVTAEELQASIVEQRQTVRALAELDCPKGER